MRSILIAFFISLIAATGAAQSLSDARIDQDVRDTMTAWHIPGLAIAVVQNDRVLFVKGYGIKEVGKSDPVTADTLFEIGSTTKAFTATAMAMLVDDKKMDWDDPVRNYVTYFHVSDPCTDSLISLRDIASHRSGVARHDELWDDSDWPREQLIRSIAVMKTSTPIRSAYQYNNLMFVTAGEAVAAAAKMPWEDFIRTRILAPLQMTESRISFADWQTSTHATGHRYDSKSDRISIQPMHDYAAIAPAGTIKSSAHDMAQWLRFQLAGGTIDGKRLLSAEALEETHTPQTIIRLSAASREANPETNFLHYGLGWNVSDYRGEVLVAHAGALNGFRTNVALLPKQNVGIAILENVGRGTALAALRYTIIDQLLGKTTRDWNAHLLVIEKKDEAQNEVKKNEREAKRPHDTKPSHPLDAYTGQYHNAGFGDAKITLDNGTLVFRWERLSIPLVHDNYDTFTATDPENDVDETVPFRLGTDGDVKSMTIFGEEFVKK